MTEADKIVYSNQVSGKVATEDLITRNYDTDFTFKCKYDRSAILSVGALSPKRKTVITADGKSAETLNFIVYMLKPLNADKGPVIIYRLRGGGGRGGFRGDQMVI